MEKIQFVENLKNGEVIRTRFCVSEKTASNGKTPHTFQLLDKTGKIKAKAWANKMAWDDLEKVEFADVEGRVEEYQGRLEVMVDSLVRVTENVELKDYLPASNRDPQEMLAELHGVIASVRQPFIKDVLTTLFSDQAFLHRFSSAPAARAYHHSYIGGLLEHTLEVVRTCDALAATIPGIKRDLLIAGALLHDIGKTEEIDYSRPAFTTTLSGGMIGHLMIGAGMVDRTIHQLDNPPADLSAALLHLILSHHGKLEWGSPVGPCMMEAYLLHFCDNISAQNFYCTHAPKIPNGADKFTRIRGLDNLLYCGELSWEMAPEAQDDFDLVPPGDI